MESSRRTFLLRSPGLLGLPLLPLLPLLAACVPGEKLVVASHVWPGYEFMFLARDEGWLAPDKIHLLETANATASLAALKDGRATAAALTLDEVILGRAQGIPLTVVLVFDISAGADKVVARPAIKSLKDIKDKRIGAETSALGALMLTKLLDAAGLLDTDVTVVPIDGPHRAAWDGQHLDVLITYEPTATELLHRGATLLYDSRQLPDTIFDVLAVRRDALPAQANALQQLVAGHFRGLRALRSNPTDTAYRLARHLGVPGNETLDHFRGLQLPDLAANQTYLGSAKTRLTEAAHALAGIMTINGQISRPDTLDQLVSAHFLPHGALP